MMRKVMTIKNRRITMLIRRKFIFTDRIPSSLQDLWLYDYLENGGNDVLLLEKSEEVEFRLFFKTRVFNDQLRSR